MFLDWEDDYYEFPLGGLDYDSEEELCGDEDCPWCYPRDSQYIPLYSYRVEGLCLE